MRAAGVSLALGALIAAPARADDSPRALAGAGIAVPVFAHTLYGAGVRVQAGAELPLGTEQPQWIRVVGRWVGLATTGARADLGMVEAAWRVAPAWATRLRFELGLGVLVEVERLRLSLPARTLDESTTRVGMPASAAVAVELWRRVELELGYQQLVFVGDQPRTAGIVHAALGARL